MDVLDPNYLVKRTRYCGGPSVSPWAWVGTRAQPLDSIPDWAQLEGRSVIPTYRGRTAIALACRLLGIGPGDEVLVPAYNCGTEIDAILSSGAKVVGYPITRRCTFESADLAARKTKRTKAVYLIHYFGWEQPMAELRKWCDAENLLLIEDCALALFSNGQTDSIGRVGDAAIYSLPKTLGVNHGGILSFAATREVSVTSLKAAGHKTILRELSVAARASLLNASDSIGAYGLLQSARRLLRKQEGPNRVEDELPRMPKSYYFNADDAERMLHPNVWKLAIKASPLEIVSRRRANYTRLVNLLASVKNSTLLHGRLPEGVCPLSLPLLTTNRDMRVAALQAAGIAAYPWWAGFYVPGLDWAEFPDACGLKHNLLTLPIHQGLDDADIDYVAERAAEILGAT